MKQGFALALASLGFACVAGQSIAAWLGMYAIALALLSMPWAQRLLATFDARTGVVLACLLAAPGVAWAVRTREAIAEHEGLHGLGTYVRDRLRLEGEPVIAPPLVAADRPQRFFVRAGVGAKRVQVKLGSAAQGIEAQALGEGLFRVDYDPRRDGVPRPANGTLLASIRVDGREATREMITTTPLAHPRWLSRSPNGERACAVSTETDELFVLASDGLRARVPVADGPIDCAFVDDATVALSYRDHAQLELRGTERGELVRSLELGARQGRMARSPSGAWLAAGIESASPGIVLLDTSAQRVLARIATADAPDWIAFGASDDVLLYSTRTHAALHRLRRDAGTGGYAPDGTLALSRPAVTLARIRGGTQLALAVTDYRADGSPQLGNHFVQDQLLFVETGSLRVVWRELTPRRSDRQSKPGDVDRGLSPMGIAENAAGDLLIAFAGSDEAWRLRADDSEPVIEDLASSDVHAPHGITQLRDGTWLVTSPAYGTALVITPDAQRTRRLVQLAPSDAQLFAHDRVALERRVGERGFYEGTRSGISCQSCHLHADSDGAAYNLGDHRLVPTLSVRGIARTAPYLRDGTYPRIADLDEVAQTLYRGYLRSQGARGETLQAFVEALPRNENPSAAPVSSADLARERRGVGTFVKAGCVGCHAFPAFTHLGKLPMAALFPDEAQKLSAKVPEMLDTPSLLGVAGSAPYLNDGRAATLEEVITKHNAKNLHGDTRSLSASERADLVAFLRSL